MCRLIRKRKKLEAAAATAVSETLPSTISSAAQAPTSPILPPTPQGALVELMERVHTMDSNEAYKQMCLAQDEIQRLQSEIHGVSQQSEGNTPQQETPILPEKACTDVKIQSSSERTKAAGSSTSKGEDSSNEVNGKSNGGKHVTSKQSNQIKKKSTNCIMRASGTWLDQGGKCSIEFLPNVQCYSMTLATAEGNSLEVPQSKESLHFSIKPVHGTNDRQFSSISSFEVKLYRLKDPIPPTTCSMDPGHDSDLIFSVTLSTTVSRETTRNPSGRISLDSNSISLRIQLQHEITTMALDGMDLMDHLLGAEGSVVFSSNTTNASDLNYLRCRKCQNPLIIATLLGNGDAPDNGNSHNSAGIQSVLPLPSGYWDDISDLLICYEGQATVDFNSSSTKAIPKTALEDDTILVMHKHDLADRGVRTVGMKGYGEHSSAHLSNNTSDTISASEAWKEKSAARGEISTPITCANCCSTLGYVSDHNSCTFRLYKHLLDCGSPHINNGVGASAFTKYTCGTFLAKEMVRYAESEAIYTFIIGISDENDWTRIHNPGACILLRVLSWETPMATVGGSSSYTPLEDPDSHKIRFQRVVKVIYEEISDKKELTAVNDDPLEWTWRDMDFCCPSPVRGTGSNTDATSDRNSNTAPRRKAFSTRIFFSKQEWSELRDTLVHGSQYFSDAMKDAVVMTKLGMPSSVQEQNATLSFLPIL